MAEALSARRYQNLQKLGHGGMGEVFLAQDSLKSQAVALKFLHRHLGHQAQDLFREEVKLLSRLSHPNLVRIYDYLEGESSQGPCFAMEYVAGNTLDRVPAATDFSQWLTWFVQLAQGLHYLHRRGILHGDLKPSNLLVNTEQELKILDFGLAALLTRKEKHAALGTLAYMPPEAFWGEYDAQSDLFSMGVLFYEMLSGRLPYQKPLTGNLEKLAAPPPLAEWRPDLPTYFCDLVQRLIELKPERRPPSALALLKFINQHADSPFEILDPEDSQIILSKTPLVGRHEEMQTFRKFLEASPSVTQVLILSGPTGVGRTRLLDDMKWQIQLKGGTFFNAGPETAPSWRKIWRESLGILEPAGKTDLLSELREIFSKIPKKNVTASFSDLHLWPSAALKELEIAVQLIPTLQVSVKIILEFASDFPNESLRSLTNHLTSYLALELKDLPPEQSRNLVKQASVDAPLGEEWAERIVTESGGRPLLLLEAVRHFMASPQLSSAERDSIPLPKNLQEVTALRIQSLSAAAQVLLATLCTESEFQVADEVRQVTGLNPEEFAAQLANLRQQGLLELRPGRSNTLGLIHPSLRLAMIEALPDALLKETHLRWLRHLEPGPQATETQATLPDPLALRLYRHAAGAGLVAELKKYGIQAAKALQSQDRLDEAIAVLHRLYQEASNAFERSFTQAHLAPVLYRAGRLQEAIRAYDLWFKDREDDASRLQKVKHCFYTGLALHTLHREDAALKRLQECLETGDSMQFPAHRPYHVQAHGLIASLHEKKGEGAAAREHLRQALAIAEGQPKLLGDIEQRWGRLEQRELNFAEARNHYHHALEHFIAEQNFQAQAIAHDLLGMLALECGELAEARQAMRTALDLAQQGGDLPQWARYRVNEALVAMEMAQYGAAQEGLEEGRLLLSSLGNAHDQILTEIHRLSLYAATGNWDRSRQILNSLKGRLTEIGQLRELAQFFLAVAELAYGRGRIESAQAYFKAALEAPQISPSNRIFAELGLYKCAVRRGRSTTLSLPPSEKTPSLQIYRAVSEFFLKPQDDEILRRALAEIKNCQRPEWRRDFYELLTRYFIGKNSERATRLRQATLIEFKNILEQLPEEQRMDYEKNREPKSLDDALDDLLPSAQNATQPEPSTKSGAGTASHIPEARFRQFSEINRQIAQKNNLKEILERVMDAAIELTGAERGFLLLKKDGHPGKGLGAFDIKTARHINQGSLQEQEFKFSMTAVEQAIQQGASLLTDNAQLDPRFQERQSVVQYQLKSILAVPLEIEGQILGAIYLDHRYQPGCFKEEDVVLLNAFSSQAALAIQKAQMIEALKQAKDKLEIKVEDQAKQIESLHGELAMVREELKYEYKEIVGQSPSMMQVFQLLDHVTETTIPVWILGESGTGKELIAHALHNNSPRRDASFVSENCSAIPETLLESELFGHKKGAFTHADRDRVGLFEQANHGTLFLDEIADMPMSMQVKLLRVLQEGEVRPLGSNKKVKIDVRLVTASNRDLNQMVKAGSFRQDLFFRINGLNIKLPPLRERKDDIPLLVNHMIEKIARSFNLKASEVSDDAFQKLLRYSWPGNIRELEGVVRNALLFAKGRLITAEFLSIPEGKESQAAPLPPGMSRALPNEEESAERQFILDALKRHQLDKEKAAEELGISLRSLYTRMEKLNIPKKKTVLAKYLG